MLLGHETCMLYIQEIQNDWTWDSQETLHEDFLIYECACIIWTNVVGSFIE